MALKQRRSSIAFRVNLKPQGPDNQTGSSASNAQGSSVVNDELPRNGFRSRDDLSTVAHLDSNVSPYKKRSTQEEPINGYNDPTAAKSKGMIKSFRSSSATKNESLTNEKSSTTCTIQ